MNFTREPIIETVISPKEGCKLIVRNSKGVGQEEYLVDAVEIISFGHALFFRSLEHPKAFLVPVGDYEVVELRETKMVLKNVALEKTIKIGGGKEGEGPKEKKSDRKRERRRSHHKRLLEEKRNEVRVESGQEEASVVEGNIPPPPPPVPRKIIPPPSTLIKEKLSKVKHEENFDESVFPREGLEEEKETEKTFHDILGMPPHDEDPPLEEDKPN